MNYKLLIIFILLNVANVIIQTTKSLATVKCGKGVAALVNAFAFALYTYVVVYTLCDLPLHLKAIIVGLCNLVGVYVVKWIEEKGRKDKLWQLSITVPKIYANVLHFDYSHCNKPLPHCYNIVGKWAVFTVYCETQEETSKAVNIAKQYEAKMFTSENRLTF